MAPSKHTDCPFEGVINPASNADMAGIDRRVGNVEQKITGLEVGMENLIGQVSELANVVRNMASASRTNWATLATWAAVVLAAMVYHSDLVMAPLRDNIIENKTVTAERFEMMEMAIQRELKLRDELEQVRLQTIEREKKHEN